MNDLEMTAAFAELEGVKNFQPMMHDDKVKYYAIENTSSNPMQRFKEYNPITDLALNCAAADKYEVETEFVSAMLMYVSINEYLTNEKIPIISLKVNKKEDLPKARIECILKSKGKL